MIRLVATLATAALVIWLAGQASEKGFDPAAHPLAQSARRTVELLGEAVARPPDAVTQAVEPVADAKPEVPVAAPVENKTVPADPAPELLLEPGRVITAPEPFVLDGPEENVPRVVATRAPVVRTPLDRESADQVRSRLDRVMSLASGRGR